MGTCMQRAGSHFGAAEADTSFRWLMGARAGDLSARRTAESEAAAAAAAEALRLKGDDVDLNRLDKVRNSCLTTS